MWPCGVAIWLSSGQLDVSQNIVCSFWVKALRVRDVSTLSLFLLAGTRVGEQTALVTEMRETSKRWQSNKRGKALQRKVTVLHRRERESLLTCQSHWIPLLACLNGFSPRLSNSASACGGHLSQCSLPHCNEPGQVGVLQGMICSILPFSSLSLSWGS